MYICERCGKGLQVGMNVSHSHRRTKRRSLPNLHVTSIMIGGRKVKSRYCTKCLRIIKASHPIVRKDSVKVSVEESSRPVNQPVAEVKDNPPAGVKEEIPAPEVRIKKNKEAHTLSDDILKAADEKVKEKEKATKEEPAEESVPA